MFYDTKVAGYVTFVNNVSLKKDTSFWESIGPNAFVNAMPDFLYNGKLYYNPVEFALDRIGGVWKMPILWRLKDRTLRYGELKKTMPKTTHKMLTAALRELEAEGFILREVYAQVPPKVEYSLTERGKRAIDIITTIRDYGFQLMEEFGVDDKKPIK